MILSKAELEGIYTMLPEEIVRLIYGFYNIEKGNYDKAVKEMNDLFNTIDYDKFNTSSLYLHSCILLPFANQKFHLNTINCLRLAYLKHKKLKSLRGLININ